MDDFRNEPFAARLDSARDKKMKPRLREVLSRGHATFMDSRHEGHGCDVLAGLVVVLDDGAHPSEDVPKVAAILASGRDVVVAVGDDLVRVPGRRHDGSLVIAGMRFVLSRSLIDITCYDFRTERGFYFPSKV